MFDNQAIEHLLYAIAIIIASAILGRVIKFLLNTVFKKLFKHTETSLDDRLLEVFRGRVTTLSIIGGIYVAIREVKKGLTAENITALQSLDYLSIALFIFLVFVLTRLAIKTVQSTFDWYLEEVSRKTDSVITPTIAPLTTKVLNILLFMIAGMIVLDHFGINIGSFLVSLGVGSLAVALAAQETVANMIAGFVILIDQPFRIGDRIKLPSGDEGDVVQIGLRSTRILNYDSNLVVIPNSELVKNRIVNFSLPEKNIRVNVEVNVAYGTNLERAKQLLLNIAKQHPDISSEPVPNVFVMMLADSSVQLKLVAGTSDFLSKFPTEAKIREEIYTAFAKERIEIPFPQRVVHVKNS
ncbi:MAG: mechanosensitive ion channel [Ignavibacteriae bacterium]|nr:mechanosensitive ion channel [Ignavibacteriota bacterium]